MNTYSLICRLIGEKPKEWKKILEEKKIRVKEDNGLCIMNYLPGSDFSDPVVQEARGIIIDAANADVVCWPFRKFGNWFETYADEIDWRSAVVQEKIDGSIIKLYFWNGEWKWATDSMIGRTWYLNQLRTIRNITIFWLIMPERRAEKAQTQIGEYNDQKNNCDHNRTDTCGFSDPVIHNACCSQ